MRREVEAKRILSEEQAGSLVRELEKIGAVETVAQVDTIYAGDLNALLCPHEGAVIARTRVADGKAARLTVKRRRTSNLDKDEAEIEISDGDEGGRLLEILGLKDLLTVKKVRHSLQLSGDPQTTINVDLVDGLGWFVEVEWLYTGDDPGELTVDQLLASLGGDYPQLVEPVQEGKPIDKGYDTLLADRRKDD